MTKSPIHGRISGPIVMIGFGSIGKGALPLIERHFEFDHSRLTVIDPSDADRKLVDERGYDFVHSAVTKDNYRELLTPLLTNGGGQGFCVNLSVDTSSVAIMELCREIGALYIDTVVEPWAGFYFDKTLGAGDRTNYALRETLLKSKRENPGGPTAISTCGANPGMVSWFVKQGLVNLAKDLGDTAPEPKTREEWAALAQRLGVKGIHIAERDTQRARNPKTARRVRQHLVGRGFCLRRHAAGGTRLGHARKMDAGERPQARDRLRRRHLPAAARRQYARARWAPTPGAQYGFLVTHNESISIVGLLHGARRQGRGGLSSDLPLRLSPRG